MEVEEGSDEKSDIQPHWMAVHVLLKNEFTEVEKSWLICYFPDNVLHDTKCG